MIILTILALVAFAWMRVNEGLFHDAFSPFNLLFFFWIAPFVLSFSNLSELQHGLSSYALAIVTTCTILLISISLTASRAVPHASRYNDFQPLTHTLVLSPLGIVVLCGFFSISVAALVIAEFSSGSGLPLFRYLAGEAEGSLLHRSGKDSPLQVVAQAAPLAGAICIFAAVTSRSRGRRILMLLMASVPPLLGLLKASKSDVFISILYYSAAAYYASRAVDRPIRWARVTTLSLLAITVIALVTSVRLAGVSAALPITYGELIAFEQRDLPFPLNEVLAVSYGYSALNFENFSRFVDFGATGPGLGTSMLRPLFSIFMQGDIPDAALATTNWQYVSSAATAGTFLRDLYGEGGITLCLLGTILYALLVRVVYVQFRRHPSGMWLFIYINFLFPWAWLAFQNAFAVLSFYANAVYVAIIYGVLQLCRTPAARDTRSVVPLWTGGS